jgi:hypothetical protein
MQAKAHGFGAWIRNFSPVLHMPLPAATDPATGGLHTCNFLNTQSGQARRGLLCARRGVRIPLHQTVFLLNFVEKDSK